MPCDHERKLIGFVKGVDENIACIEAADGILDVMIAIKTLQQME